MYILIFAILLCTGFIGLIKGADLFVNGSSALAHVFGVSRLIIGLTIVALGTSAPELAVSTLAAFQKSNELALSNVIGSNTFNLLCVLGVCAVIYPLPVDKDVLRRDFPYSIITTGLLMIVTSGLVMFDESFLNLQNEREIGTITRFTGLILILLFTGYIIFLVFLAKRNLPDEIQRKAMPVWKCFLQIMAGLFLIVAGGQAVVHGAKGIARAAGMTETLIGLTIVAVGTSLPELVTSIVAARKGETELAIGNVLGSNVFNLLFILGISSLIHPIAVNLASVYDMCILFLVSILVFVFSLSSKRIVRYEGIIMLVIYVADVVFAIIR